MKLDIREIKPDTIGDHVSELLDKGGRLIYVSGADMGVKGIKINYYFGFDHQEKGKHTILRTYLDRENPVVQSITPITTQADWSERELIEFLGVKGAGPPEPYPFVAAAELGGHVPGRSARVQPGDGAH